MDKNPLHELAYLLGYFGNKGHLDTLEDWRFNLSLECSGASLAPLEGILVGGTCLDVADLLAALEWAVPILASTIEPEDQP